MKIKLKLLPIMMLLLTACGPGLNDDVKSLGAGYFYVRDGVDHKYIYYKQSSERKDIYPKVVSYTYDSTFILAAQIPIKKYIQAHVASSLNVGQKSFDTLLLKADSLIENDPYFVKIFSSSLNYWIIDKEKNQVYGPLSKARFVEERKRLKVSENLLLP